MHLAPLIRDLAVILIVASLASLLFRRLRQPAVLGYLLAGIVLGPHTPPFSWVTDIPGVQVWSELGVIFLLFSLGLEFSFERLRGVGRTPIITGTLEASFMLAVGFIAGKVANWSTVDSLFLGAILSVSSTAIIVKAIEELGLKRARFAELVFASLIVDDMVGILILAGITVLGAMGFSPLTLVVAFLKLVGLVVAWALLGHFLLVRWVNRVGTFSDREGLTLLAMGLCLGLVVASTYFHLSAALGAFLMGSILAGTTYAERIDSLVMPLRDVFGAIFFVATGMLLNPKDVAGSWGMILVALLATVLGKVVSVYLGARLCGENPGTCFQMGCAMAQIGEFSFMIAGVGLGLGVMRPSLYPLAVTVSVVTTLTTPYLIRYSQRLIDQSR